ncbi:hypothetical protein [Mycobacterium kiyosense]|uniref:hypothetical protein n=1 Tax=Mycobacterium kiyosense TaxID=2871094 RepID=UPI00216FC9B7|nr:hypothetical protein [Mycobacterium kiyosense]GLD38581.1 hypothetical protein Mkiyose1595_48010 [Mycobacterium kiyosense]
MSRQREATKRRDSERRSWRAGAGRPTAADPSARRGRSRTPAAPNREARVPRSGPQTSPITRPVDRPARPKNSSQAKARAKARKAKAPKVVRPKLTERLAARLAEIDLRPHVLLSRVPFVVLIIGSLGVGLGLTLWLSTAAAERSYQLSDARDRTRMLQQQKESLERDVRDAESAPALSEAARKQGMIPSRDTAHLVQAPDGNWVVVGTPKPAEGVPPPPLNTKLPEETPQPPKPQAPPPEVAVRVPSPNDPAAPARSGPQVLLRGPDGTPTLAGPLPQGQLPGVPGQLPAVPGQLPAVPGQLPAAPGQLPGVAGQVPAAPGLTPAAPGGQVPGQVPAPNSVHSGLLPPPAVTAPAPALPAAPAPGSAPPLVVLAPPAAPAPADTEQPAPGTPR